MFMRPMLAYGQDLLLIKLRNLTWRLHRRTVPALERGNAQAVHAAGGVRGRVQLRNLLVRGQLVQQRAHARRQRRARIAPVRAAGRRRIRQLPRQRVEACIVSARVHWVLSMPSRQQAGSHCIACRRHASAMPAQIQHLRVLCRSLQSTCCAARRSSSGGPRASCSLAAGPAWRAALLLSRVKPKTGQQPEPQDTFDQGEQAGKVLRTRSRSHTRVCTTTPVSAKAQ